MSTVRDAPPTTFWHPVPVALCVGSPTLLVLAMLAGLVGRLGTGRLVDCAFVAMALAAGFAAAGTTDADHPRPSVPAVRSREQRTLIGIGAVGGGLGAAALLWAVGSVVRPLLPTWTWEILVLICGLLVAAHEVGSLTWKVPRRPAPLDPALLRRGRVGAVSWGLQLGSCTADPVGSSLPLAVAAAVLLVAGWRLALVMGVAFGLGRLVALVAAQRFGPPGEWERTFGAFAGALYGGLTVAVCVDLAAALMVLA